MTAETFYRLGGLLREPLLSALDSRASRQSGKIETVNEKIFACTSQKQAEAFLAISQNCKKLILGELRILGDIGIQGWAALAEGFRCRRSYNVSLSSVVVSREVMLQGRLDDLKTLWNGLSDFDFPTDNPVQRGKWTMMYGDWVETFYRYVGHGGERETEREWGKLIMRLEGEEDCFDLGLVTFLDLKNLLG